MANEQMGNAAFGRTLPNSGAGAVTPAPKDASVEQRDDRPSQQWWLDGLKRYCACIPGSETCGVCAARDRIIYLERRLKEQHETLFDARQAIIREGLRGDDAIKRLPKDAPVEPDFAAAIADELKSVGDELEAAGVVSNHLEVVRALFTRFVNLSKAMWEDAEAEIRDQANRIAALEAALREARREIIGLAQAGTDKLLIAGVDVDPAEKTYGPAVARIDSALTLTSGVASGKGEG